MTQRDDAPDADVLVVGGGPAGLSAAYAAARAGAQARLFERGTEIGWPVRTSGGSWLADLDNLGIPRALAHPVHRVRFVAPGRAAAWSYASPRLCILDVTGVYRFLAQRAVAAGAHVEVGHTVLGPALEGGRVVGVRVRGDAGATRVVRASVTVDASGHAAVIARRAGLQAAYRRFGVGVEYDLNAPAFNPDEALLLVGRDVADRGYAWAFPHGDGRVRVGVGVLRPDSDVHPRPLLDRLLRHPALAGPLHGAELLEVHTGVLPAEPPRERVVADGLLLVGDSAAQASPLVGEGIRYAIRAGHLAGQAAADAVRRGDVSAAGLGAYPTAWRQAFGRELAIAGWVSQRAAHYGDRNWRVVAALLGQLDAAQVAAGLHGDFTAEWWLGLAVASPRLAATAVGSLLAERRRLHTGV